MKQTMLRDRLLLLRGEGAHMSFAQAVASISVEALNQRPPNTPYRLWQIVDHIRIAQWDILEYMREPGHVSPDFPVGYWPDPDERVTEERWLEILAEYDNDLQALVALVENPEVDLLASLAHDPDYTVFRGILTAGDHAAYHIGEFAVLRQVMDNWNG